MSSKTYTLIAHTPGSSQPIRHNFVATQDPLKALRVKVVPGARYELVDNATGFAPQQLQVKRIGKNLLMGIDLDKPEQSSLILEDYYAQPGALVTGLAENGQTYPFIPDTANPVHAIDKLADGTQITQVLGGTALAPFAAGIVAGTAVTAAAVAPLALSPALLAGIGLGALALGAGGGGGDGDKAPPPAPPSVTIESLATDGRINASEAPATRITGTSNQPNTTLTIRASDDTNSTITREVTTDANGRWTADLDLSTLKDGNISVTASAAGASHTRDADKDTQAPTPTDNATPQAGQFNAGLAPEADTGTPGDNKTNNTRPTLAGKGDPGDTIEVVFSPTETKTVTVGPDGAWRLTPTTPLPPGPHSFQVRAIDPSGNVSDPANVALDIDTTPLGITIANNFADLNTNPAKDTQDLLNLAESANGVTYTINFSTTPLSANGQPASLQLANLNVQGGTLRQNSLTKVSDTQYTVVLEPTPGVDSGTLSIGIADNSFHTAAGNPNAAAAAPNVLYDTQAPTPTFMLGTEALPTELHKLDAATIAELVAQKQDWPLGAQLSSQDIADLQLLLNDQTIEPDGEPINGLYSFALEPAQLAALPDGIYTLRYNATDTAGNQASADQIIDKTSAPAYVAPLQDSDADGTLTGTVNSERFLNTAGNQTFTGGGANDTYFWLLRDHGTAGTPDIDRITDFAMGNPATTAWGDRINLVDLIQRTDPVKPLSAFVQLQLFDTPGSPPGNDSTRLLISHNGQFQADGSNVATTADQWIELQGVSTTLDELTQNGQLITGWPLP